MVSTSLFLSPVVRSHCLEYLPAYQTSALVRARFWPLANMLLHCTCSLLTQSETECFQMVAVHRIPKDIARLQRAFNNAHKLGLLRSVRIVAGPKSCEAVRAQRKTEYLGDTVPRLPLAECTRELCQCDYEPRGSKLLKRLNVSRPRRNKPEH